MLVVQIHNDGTGTELHSNYDWSVSITVRDGNDDVFLRKLASGRIEDHDRRQDWRKLVRKVVHPSRRTVKKVKRGR
jgi:hypothetical protein